MTSIVYRDGILAADSASFCNGLITDFEREKITRVPGGIFAAAGDLSAIRLFKEWLEGGALRENRPHLASDSLGAIVCWDDGRVEIFEEELAPFSMGSHGWAVQGSSHDFLVGCMVCGKSAVEAVQLAIRYHYHSAGVVKWARVGPARKKQGG